MVILLVLLSVIIRVNRMTTISKAIKKMIIACEGSQYDICHFMKVWAYAKLIGDAEELDEKTQQTLELAAVVHDIACPGLRKEYGSAPGDLQEKYGPPMVPEFYKDMDIDPEMLDRIAFLVGHHHSFTGIDGMDWQILLEADFLVNAGEKEKYLSEVEHFRKNVFKTETGIQLLDSIYRV